MPGPRLLTAREQPLPRTALTRNESASGAHLLRSAARLDWTGAITPTPSAARGRPPHRTPRGTRIPRSLCATLPATVRGGRRTPTRRRPDLLGTEEEARPFNSGRIRVPGLGSRRGPSDRGSSQVFRRAVHARVEVILDQLEALLVDVG